MQIYACYDVNQQNGHTLLELQYCYNRHELLHISGLTDPPTGGAQSHKTAVRSTRHNARYGKCKEKVLNSVFKHNTNKIMVF